MVGCLGVVVAGILMRRRYRRRVLSRIVLGHAARHHTPADYRDGSTATRAERRLRSERLLAVPSVVGDAGATMPNTALEPTATALAVFD